MPEYLAPGVYVEEIEMGSKPIEGVSTSVAGFLGETERGPIKPKLVTSWLQYQRIFGSYFDEDKYMPFAVQGFFENGGKSCYIARIVNSNSEAASLTIKDINNFSTELLDITSIGPGTWGNNIAIKISESTTDGLKLTVYYFKDLSDSILLDPEINLKSIPQPKTAKSEKPTDIEVFDNLEVDQSSPDFIKKRVNDISNLVKVEIKPNITTELITLAKGLKDSVKNLTQPDIVNDLEKSYKVKLNTTSTTNDVYNGMTIEITDGKGKGQIRTITGYNGLSKVATIDPPWNNDESIPDDTSHYKINLFVKLKDGFNYKVTGTGTPASGSDANTKLILANEASAENDFYNGQLIQIGEQTPRKIVDYDGSSKTVTVSSSWETTPSNDVNYNIYFITKNKLSLNDFKGLNSDGGIPDPENKRGLNGFEEVDEISLVYAPASENISDLGLTRAVIDHCENLKDRFALIDSPSNATDIGTLRPRDKLDSKYAAYYYPWLNIINPADGKLISIPPSGHVAGIYARSDTERGVFKAPANEVVRGIEGLKLQITKNEQGTLNPRSVNVIRSFQGRGIRVWGARTLSSDSLWKYINVRRLFIYLEESIDEGTQWVVFEPNDEKLWARVRQTINQFLTQVWKDGALMGNTPEEAFFVKCDRTTMTQNDIDNGKLIVIIGVSPVKPAEFVIFRIAQWTAGAKS
jgi:phage tail sheath protein FI